MDAAFAKRLMEHRARLHAFVYAQVRDPHLTEDVLQEVAVVLANPTNYYVQKANEPGNNSNWLLGPSFYSCQQDPPTWLKDDLLDAWASMQYTAVDATWQSEVQIWKSLLGFRGVATDKAYMGLGWTSPTEWFADSNFDAPAMVRFTKYGRSQGIKGFTIFRLGQPGIDDSPPD